MNTFNLNLDLDKRGGVAQWVTLRQGDRRGTELRATIYDHGTQAGGGYTCRVSIRLPGEGNEYYRETATYTNGVAVVTVDEEYAAAIVGVTEGYFELLQGDAVIASTESFGVRILRSAQDGAVPGDKYDSAIEDALAELDEATGRISQMVVDATEEYLEAHPELTTTVEDNSLTDAKLIQHGGILDRVARLWHRLDNLLTATPAESDALTVTDAAKTPLAGLALYGRSTQDGTPTPSSPVPIVSVGAANLVDYLTNYYASAVDLVDGKLVNKATDSKTFATPVIQTMLNGTTQETLYFSNQNVTDAGTYGRMFVVTKAFDSIRIKHNGSSEDVTFLRQGMSGKEGVSYYATITFDGINPSVVGGMIASDIALYESTRSKAYTPYGTVGLWTRGKNLLLGTNYLRYKLDNGITWTVNADGSVHAKGTSTSTSQVYWYVPAADAQSFGGMVLSGAPNVSGCSVRLEMRTTPYTVYAADTTGAGATINIPSSGAAEASLMCRVDSGKTVDVTFRPMIRLAGTDAAYQPYAESVTPIPLQGHALRSLPDGTRDEVTVDQYGHATLVQRVGEFTVTAFEGTNTSGGRPYGYKTISGKSNVGGQERLLCDKLTTTSGSSYYLSNNPANVVVWGLSGQTVDELKAAVLPYTVQYPLATPVTIDLGTIDPIALQGPDMTAQAVPTAPFALTYERDLNVTLARLEAAIADAATA